MSSCGLATSYVNMYSFASFSSITNLIKLLCDCSCIFCMLFIFGGGFRQL